MRFEYLICSVQGFYCCFKESCIISTELLPAINYYFPGDHFAYRLGTIAETLKIERGGFFLLCEEHLMGWDEPSWNGRTPCVYDIIQIRSSSHRQNINYIAGVRNL